MKRESFKVNEEEYKLLLRLRDIKKEEMQKNRLDTIKMNTRRIGHYERVIEDKQNQVNKKDSQEKHENYLDGKKPLFMLQNEIEELEANIEQLKEINKNNQEEYDKDKGAV